VIVQPTAQSKIGNYRWVVCALLFFATTINYVDRQTLSLLNPILKKEIGWSDADFGYINAAFQIAYAIGMLAAGYLMDRLGTRRGFSLVIVFWSVAATLHAAARSAFAFGAARFLLGFGEAGNFPAAIKTVAEWFPRKERSLATGVMNAGTNVGATLAPIAVPVIAVTMGWPWAFILTGTLGFLWLAFWLPLYRSPTAHPRISQAERGYILSDQPAEPPARISWAKLLPHRQTWAFMLGKFLTDPVWWFYLTWLPTFLHEKFGLDLKSFGLPLVVIYLMADLGSVGGGWLSTRWIQRGRDVNSARKFAMLACALCVLPIFLATSIGSLWPLVLMIGLAAAAHQGWSCNLFTLASDMFPRQAIGSVVGLGGMAGALGGALLQIAVGNIVDKTHGNYFVPFLYAASAYLLALALIHALAPRLEPATVLSQDARPEFRRNSQDGQDFMN
jgi:ACS family hexuronate transporter-like MFS transporter